MFGPEWTDYSAFFCEFAEAPGYHVSTMENKFTYLVHLLQRELEIMTVLYFNSVEITLICIWVKKYIIPTIIILYIPYLCNLVLYAMTFLAIWSLLSFKIMLSFAFVIKISYCSGRKQ